MSAVLSKDTASCIAVHPKVNILKLGGTSLNKLNSTSENVNFFMYKKY